MQGEKEKMVANYVPVYVMLPVSQYSGPLTIDGNAP